MLIKTQSKFDDSQRESPKPSEIKMYIEMGIASAAVFGLFTIVAWVLYSAHDWISSIQRFQEMI